LKRLGDGLLAVFSLASDAIETALGVIDQAREIGIAVRAAVHVAEVEQLDDDVLGLGVTVAARVLGHAGSGDVLTTRSVADLLIGSGFQFNSRGRHELKGIPGSLELTAVKRP
jgi:class 3 adenylate cyclase